MKTRRTLIWGTVALVVVLAVAGCCPRKVLPDVQPTAVGGVQDVPMGEDAQNTEMAGTAHARETLTAQPGDMAGDTPSSPEATPTEAPSTAIPTSAFFNAGASLTPSPVIPTM